ncbi:MAG TPA: 2'-deoxycytidine 5'-triphosphate deaminase [Bryobacteraceae bacterium]|nr:2'-deoxycytidine 5'-triphosphate deaminase [Bryobacteraceae bacterium]
MSSPPLALFPELFQEETEFNRTGVLPYQKLQDCVERGYISAACRVSPEQIQPSSIDLRLGRAAWQVSASFLPTTNSTVKYKSRDLLVGELDLSVPTVLRTGSIYIVALQEEVALPASVWGKANPKSTTGRLDVFTRLLADYVDSFDYVPNGYRGKLYVEIVPRTFSIVVREGSRLNQLRLLRGNPPAWDRMLVALHERETLLYSQDDLPQDPVIRRGLWLTVDVTGTRGSDIVGYRARRNTDPIDLAKVDYYDPAEYWHAIERPATGSVVLAPEEFYILVSRERVRIPPQYAAEMVPLDPSVGEFRIHYAGFFDPGFGYGADELKGSHAVLEVRSHEVPFLIEDGQRVGRLLFEQLVAPPEKLYGCEIGSSYQSQGLALSKQFRRTSA